MIIIHVSQDLHTQLSLSLLIFPPIVAKGVIFKQLLRGKVSLHPRTPVSEQNRTVLREWGYETTKLAHRGKTSHLQSDSNSWVLRCGSGIFTALRRSDSHFHSYFTGQTYMFPPSCKGEWECSCSYEKQQ